MRRVLLLVSVVSLFTFTLFSLTGFGDSAENVVLDETLPVQLSSFTASVLATGFVQLQWVAETETNMLGYNVYRASENNLADAVTITSRIIPARNTSVTTEYTFTDEDVFPGESYFYWLQSVDLDLTNEFYGPITITLDEEGEGGGPVPDKILTKLIGAYPNPFNPGTYISFSLSEKTVVNLSVYNLKGQVVCKLIDSREFAAGRNHIVYWDGKDAYGSVAVSGIYLYLMETSCGYSEARKMLLMK